MTVHVGTGTQSVWSCVPCEVGWSGRPWCWNCGRRGSSGPLNTNAVAGKPVPPDPPAPPPVIGWLARMIG